MKNFLERLRSADERIKTGWLIALSAISMVIVVFVWVKYFNNLIMESVSTRPVEEESRSFSFWQTMENGTAFLRQDLSEKIRNFGAMLAAPRNYIIQPPK